MEKTRLSSKGQIIIPKAVRDAHGWGEGTEFTVEDTNDGIVLRPERKRLFPKKTIEEVIGCSGYMGPPKTLEDMKRGVDEAMRERWDRKRK
jgi:AbrB family looped-hinge helix DNA binding protein